MNIISELLIVVAVIFALAVLNRISNGVMRIAETLDEIKSAYTRDATWRLKQ